VAVVCGRTLGEEITLVRSEEGRREGGRGLWRGTENHMATPISLSFHPYVILKALKMILLRQGKNLRG